MLTTFKKKKKTFLLKKLNKTENTPSLLGSNKLKKSTIFSSASKLRTFAVISRYIHTVYSLILYYNYSI